MSIEVTRTNLVSSFLAAWKAHIIYKDYPVVTENVKANPQTTVPWIFIALAPLDSVQPCLGRVPNQTWERDRGDCVLALHVPMDWSGDGLAVAEDARRILSQKRFGETLTDVGRTIPAGTGEDGKHYLYNVIIPFKTDNIKEE